MPHITLAAETIAHIGPLPITNSLLATWTVMAILIAVSFFATKKLTLVPSSHLTSILEMLIDALHSFFSSILGHQTNQIFPLAASLFLFILVANWEGLLPGFGTVGIYRNETAAEVQQNQPSGVTEEQAEAPQEERAEKAVQTQENTQGTAQKAKEPEFVPLFRGATADLNMTIALAIIAVVAMQYFGFKTLGIHYGKRFINFKGPMDFFIGILEIVSDTSKVVSFAFRLFGNIFAGEVLLSVMAFIMPFIAPTPFLLMELFVGFIQALVFSTLTSVFINVAVSHEG
jgi:F-type H+-transporting ATPase subunit a